MDWKDIVGKVAPVIGGALGGPFGAAGAQFLTRALLGKDTATESELEMAVLSATPEQLAAMRAADNDFKVKMRELGFKEQELYIKDVQNARESGKAVKFAPQIVLSIVYTIGYFAVLYQFTTGEIVIAAQTKAEFNMVLGVMTAAQVQIMNFWFGSSSGSKEKTAQQSKVT